MSCYKIGDIIHKKANAGFVGPAETCIIPDVPENHDEPEPCCLCNDPECVCWPTLYILGDWGEPTGALACHVSECQMEVYVAPKKKVSR